MEIYYYLIFTIFAFIVCAMVVDENVSISINLLFKIVKLQVERIYWMIRLHPKNPITNLKMKWKYDKLAKKLHDELVKSKESSYNAVVIEDADHEQNP